MLKKMVTLVTIFGFGLQCLMPTNSSATKINDSSSYVYLKDSNAKKTNNENDCNKDITKSESCDYQQYLKSVKEFIKTKEGKAIVGGSIGALFATLTAAWNISSENKKNSTAKKIETEKTTNNKEKSENISINEIENKKSDEKQQDSQNENIQNQTIESSKPESNTNTSLDEENMKIILKNIWNFIIVHKYYAIGIAAFIILTIILTLKPVRKFFWKKIGRNISRKKLGLKRFIQKHVKDAYELGLLNYHQVKEFYKENWWKYYNTYKIVTLDPYSKEFWEILYEINDLFGKKYLELGGKNEDVMSMDEMVATFIECAVENPRALLEFFKKNLTSAANWEFDENSNEVCSKIISKQNNNLMPLKYPFSVCTTLSLQCAFLDEEEDTLGKEICAFRNMYFFAVDHFALILELLSDIGDEDGMGKNNYDDLKVEYMTSLANSLSNVNSSMDDNKEIYSYLVKQAEIAKIIINILLGDGYYKKVKEEFKVSQWSNAPGEKNYRKAKFFCEKLNEEIKKEYNINENLDLVRNVNIENKILID